MPVEVLPPFVISSVHSLPVCERVESPFLSWPVSGQIPPTHAEAWTGFPQETQIGTDGDIDSHSGGWPYNGMHNRAAIDSRHPIRNR